MGKITTGKRSSLTKNSKNKTKVRGRPFPKGKSGNPRGRPRDGSSYAEILRGMGALKDVRSSKGELIERKRALCERIWSLAIRDGNLAAMNMIMSKEPTEPGASEDPRRVLVILQQVILQATRQYPEARRSIVEALEALPTDTGEGT